jgi:hypothetical protein
MDELISWELHYLYPNGLLVILRKVAQLLFDRLGRLTYIQGVLSQIPGECPHYPEGSW